MDASESGALPQDEEPKPLERVIWWIGGPPSHPLSVHIYGSGWSASSDGGRHGGTVTLISHTTKEKLFPQAKVLPSKVVLQTYTIESDLMDKWR